MRWEAKGETVVFKREMLGVIENLFSFEYILKYVFGEPGKNTTHFSLE